MSDRSARFLDMSAWLTGCSPFMLRGTGMLDDYLSALDMRLPPGWLDDLLASGACDATLDHPRLGPVARTIILLWYTGAWTALDGLPEGPDHKPGVLSATSYQAGLMWQVAGAHPSGAEQQGFGAWALQPETSP